MSYLSGKLGQEIGTSRWFLIDQDRINTFADTTEDQQFIHTDPERAAQTPFGGTIAHGFLTLSMLSTMAEDTLPIPDNLVHTVNYGFDKIRFISPVHAGKNIRAVFTLKALETTGKQITQTLIATVEIEGSDKPALVAEWISRHYLA